MFITSLRTAPPVSGSLTDYPARRCASFLALRLSPAAQARAVQ